MLHYEILIDKKENKKKCSLSPLSGKENFSFSPFSSGLDPIAPLSSDILLHVNGEDLHTLRENYKKENKRIQSIALIDCNWRKVEPLMRRLEKPWPVLVKIPPGFKTAYPRRSKNPGVDPEAGLASVEALFIASAFLSIWDMDLLEGFHFKDDFLEKNKENWKKYKLSGL